MGFVAGIGAAIGGAASAVGGVVSAVSPYLAFAGTAMSAFGQYSAGQAAQQQAAINNQIAMQNAKLAEQQAARKEQQGYDKARAFQQWAEEFKATQRVGFNRGGVLMMGSVPTVLEETAAELEADRMKILEEGFLAAAYRLSEAANLRLQGSAYLQQGAAAARGAALGALGTILTGLPTLPGVSELLSAPRSSSFLDYGSRAGGAPRLTSSQKESLATTVRF